VSKLFWIAIAVALAVALLSFVTRRPRDARSGPKLGPGSLQNAPLDRIAAAIRAGHKIEAIKLLRESSGVGLAEAKEAVEQLEKNLSRHGTIAIDPPQRLVADPDSVPGVRAAVAAGDTIEAIKLYRAHVGVGLEEAKEAIDALRARR